MTMLVDFFATGSGLMRAAAMAFMLLWAGAPAYAQPASTSVDLHTVIRAGDAESLRQAIVAGGSLDARDNWGRTPLIVALQQGKTASAELLIQHGASIALTDAWGRTPLLVATQLKNTAVIRLLLARGADVNAANKNDITPLIAAAQTGNLDAARLLLDGGAVPDRADNLGWSALMWAASRNDATLVKLLVERGADVGITGRDRATALELARRRGADAALLALLSAPTGAAALPKPLPSMSIPVAGPLLAQRLPAIDARRIVRGRVDAPITLVEYTDFQCPYCAFGAKTVDEVMARYEGQVRLLVKHLPLAFHPMAKPAATYFEALSLQSEARAWAYYDRLFANPRILAAGEPALSALAADLGADLPRLEQDLRSAQVQDRLAADLREVQQYRFDGVPAFIINGYIVEGAQPAQKFFDIIDAILHR